LNLGLVELATHDVVLMEEEPSPSKKRIQKLKHVTERQKSHERLDARFCNTSIIKRRVVNQDHVEGFLMKQDYISTHIQTIIKCSEYKYFNFLFKY
jgi:hypothetical protein